MPNSVEDNQAKRKLAAGELALCMGINQMRTPNIAMIAAACGFGAIYIDLLFRNESLLADLLVSLEVPLVKIQLGCIRCELGLCLLEISLVGPRINHEE